MLVGSKEHYNIIEQFEKTYYKHRRLDKEAKEDWVRQIVYQDGMTNELYKAFIAGYSFARSEYMNN